MAGKKKINLKYLKALMVVSELLLVLFAAQWLYTQYRSNQDELKTGLTKVFTDVQHKISDSLLLSQAFNPADTTYYSIEAHGDVVNKHGKNTALSPGGLYNVLSSTSNISTTKEKELFTIDTIAFNEMFCKQMKASGWNFNSQWINNNDSNKDGKNIFIKSSFFTEENGIVVKNYRGYLLWMLLPQIFFVFILLAVTGIAFLVTYRSLKSQIKLSQLKDDFISNMSHELKTPISTVKLALEALGNYNVIDNPQQNRAYLGMATAEMDRLELLATRVLNTSLLETGKMSLQREQYDLQKLVQEVLQTMQIRFEHHHAKISLEVTGNNFTVPVDKLHIQGVIVNLLDNSLKYAITPPDIHIALAENNGSLRLAFKDNGPGIPEEYREKVFEKFFRVPNGLRHNTQGYGLGLSYAAQVMRQHNGSINVNNITTGGCVFTLTF
jgi:signal transduction histidine kinase